MQIPSVFLFMGLASLPSNQFWVRFTMFFMQPSKYPDEVYAKYCSTYKVHLFTAIQVFLFGSLMVFRSIKDVAIAFPIIIKLCIPIRMYILPKFFTEEELILLDAEDDAIERLVERLENDKGIHRAETGSTAFAASERKMISDDDSDEKGSSDADSDENVEVKKLDEANVEISYEAGTPADPEE